MKSFFGRLGQPLKSSLSALFAPAEDPRIVFGDQLQRQRELLQEVQQAIAGVVALKEQLRGRVGIIREKLPELDEEARRALVDGREDLARMILQRWQVASREGQRLEKQVNSLEDEDQRLALLAQRLAAQIETLATRRNVVAAQYSAAEARVRITEALASVSKDLGNLGLDAKQAEQKAEQMQALATAIDSLAAQGDVGLSGLAGGDQLERQFDQLALEQAVGERIALLKSQIAPSKPPEG